MDRAHVQPSPSALYLYSSFTLSTTGFNKPIPFYSNTASDQFLYTDFSDIFWWNQHGNVYGLSFFLYGLEVNHHHCLIMMKSNNRYEGQRKNGAKLGCNQLPTG